MWRLYVFNFQKAGWHLRPKFFHSNAVTAIKNKKGIERRYRSCHNAISKYNSVFHAYVPAKFI
ncbi:hypothetical protein EGC80_16375 [Shewanella psychromarinicola]|uniref:Uncharacterized protein n=1 Tax=Shewanella psychromarinicola TaxID=2487742 RepID=A0A3N4DRK5_9GAMM|nr:hypothetical protein EGC80_16375 [Shewanella psychromarinicola]RPA27397.1 hypothetical protein EGC77_17650 [Shewanella psychromarinicola]